MKELDKWVRGNIRNLKGYQSARSEVSQPKQVMLDANESPFGKFNRYPDPVQRELKACVSERFEVSSDQVFIGNGSDEIIDLVYRIFCEPGKDQAVTVTPTYGMYKVSANVNDVELTEVPLINEFELDVTRVMTYGENPVFKLLFICSPNNPTGNSFDFEQIELLARGFKGIVVIDEAYADFSSSKSAMSLVNSCPNVLVVRTLSKAYGLAAARIGVGIGSSQLIAYFNKVKPPYNVSSQNQLMAIQALNDRLKGPLISEIIRQRTLLEEKLIRLKIVKRVYPSDANFLLVAFGDAKLVYQTLLKNGIVVRDRSKEVAGCLRLTVGSAEQNELMLNVLESM